MGKVNVYTTNTCPYCVRLKNYLKDQDIPFNEINLEKQPEMMKKVVEATGQMGVPQSEVNGKWIIGFDPESIKAAL